MVVNDSEWLSVIVKGGNDSECGTDSERWQMTVMVVNDIECL